MRHAEATEKLGPGQTAAAVVLGHRGEQRFALGGGMDLFRQETCKTAEESGPPADADPEMLGHLLVSVAVLWPLSVRIEFADAEAQRVATARLARELKRLLLYGVLRPEQWPRLVEDVQARRNP